MIYLATALCLLATSVFAQVNSGLMTTLSAVAGQRDRMPIEKLYLQLDKPYYALGDTLRFKAYLLNADFLKPSLKSGLLYVELDDNANKCVKRMMVPVVSGLSWGDMALVEKDFPEGSYTLRAYTNWMLNFGEDYVFKKSINISALSGSTLVKATFKADKNKIFANLRFTGLDKNPFRLKDMQLKVMNGRHTLIKDKAVTGMDGSMDVNFELPENVNVKDLSIQAQEIRKGAEQASTLTIPVTLNRPENTDVQFMPEGSNMVAGIPTKIGFKAISEDGKAANISGRVYSSKGQEIVAFASTHKGMGSFELTPQAGETYSAKVNLPGNTIKSYPLPMVNPTGTALRIEAKGEQLEVTINATPDLLNGSGTYYLIAQTRGLICYTAPISFKGSPIKKTIGKDQFPTGIAHFTLLNNTSQALNERIVYIAHNDNLQVSIASSKPNYTIRDSIALAITVKDNAGKPVKGNFSLAVTDDSQVKTDSAGSTIISNLLMTSDLKGTVEEPGWYFESGSNKAIALDNLLLTQGWVGYDWKAIFNPIVQQPKFTAEPEFIVQGKVTNVLNKGVEKSDVVLFSRKPELVKETMTDKDGVFVFKGLFPIDTAEFKIQARNKAGKSFDVGIEMLGEFKPPVFPDAGLVMPWYVNSDTVSLNNSSTKAAQEHAQATLRGEGRLLKEVTIKEKKIVKGSKNLNGPGEADQVFDEQDMLKAGKMTLEDFLAQHVKGFLPKGGMWVPCPSCDRVPRPGASPPMPWPCVNRSLPISYVLIDKMIHFVFDGIDVNQFYAPPLPMVPLNLQRLGPWDVQDRYNYLKHYLDYFTAEDITGVEVMFNTQFNANYSTSALEPILNALVGNSIAYIEITTRAGKGPFMKLTPGTYLYKPLSFIISKDFYRPRYTIKNVTSAIGTDLRSTIYWEPDVITDKDGKATVSFFSADKPADYTVVLEGTDLNGGFGYSRQKIKVAPTTTAK